MQNPGRAEAERLLGVSEKLLYARDLNGSRDFALLSQETDPLLEGPDQILAIVDVLLATEKRVSPHSSHHDWYSILQIPHRPTDDPDLIKRHYRRLALLLHPDKNKYPFADQAFRFAAAAWTILSDPSKKSLFDKEFPSSSPFSRVDLASPPSSSSSKLPVRRNPPDAHEFPLAPSQQHQMDGSAAYPSDNSHGNGGAEVAEPPRPETFWTACPYCYFLYELPGVYIDCCIRCPGCQRAFQAVLIEDPPPPLPGKEAYHCCWGMFPLGFEIGVVKPKKVAPSPAPSTAGGEPLPDWMGQPGGASGGSATGASGTPGKRKRGRPRKNPVPA